jgi:hypothetical protein
MKFLPVNDSETLLAAVRSRAKLPVDVRLRPVRFFYRNDPHLVL